MQRLEKTPEAAIKVVGTYLHARGHAGEQFQIDAWLAWQDISMPAATRHVASDEEANQICSISGMHTHYCSLDRSASFRNGGTCPDATPTGERSTGTMNKFVRSFRFVPGLSTRGGGWYSKDLVKCHYIMQHIKLLLKVGLVSLYLSCQRC